jgi:hypothetical protein
MTRIRATLIIVSVFILFSQVSYAINFDPDKYDQDPTRPSVPDHILIQFVVLLLGGYYLLWQLVKWLYGAHHNEETNRELTEGFWPVIIFLGWPILLAILHLPYEAFH